MTFAQARKTAEQWRDGLLFVSELTLDCEMEPSELSAQLGKRQQAIIEIQRLDAAVKSIATADTEQWTEQERNTLRHLLDEGSKLASHICFSDSQLIEKATKKREEILRLLQKSALSKGYLASNHDPSLRPAAIVDDNA